MISNYVNEKQDKQMISNYIQARSSVTQQLNQKIPGTQRGSNKGPSPF